MTAPFTIEKTTARVWHITHTPSNTNMGAFSPADARKRCRTMNNQHRAQSELLASELARLDRNIAGALK